MPTPKTAQATGESVATMSPQEATPLESPKPSETYTNWRAFAAAKLVPVRIDCHSYATKGRQGHDASCHSRIPLPATPAIFSENHIAKDHGGKFQFYLRKSDGKQSPLWEQLMSSGLEALDLRCEVCDEQLRFHPSSFEKHLRRHPGQTKQAYTQVIAADQNAQGLFNVTLGVKRPESVEDIEELA
jgi:hypothetical protein